MANYLDWSFIILSSCICSSGVVPYYRMGVLFKLNTNAWKLKNMLWCGNIGYNLVIPGADFPHHYPDVIMGTIASQITSLTIVYSTVYSDADQRRYQSSASLAFVWGIHRRPVNSPHKWPVTRKMFSFDDVIMLIKKALPSICCLATFIAN